MTTSPEVQPLKARPGRPTIHHDNSRVQELMVNFDFISNLAEVLPRLDDVLTGMTHLQTEGQASTRPLSKKKLFRVLRSCPVISTAEVALSIGRSYSRATVARYALHARAASKVVEHLLHHNPQWMKDAITWHSELSEFGIEFGVAEDGLSVGQ